MANLSNINDKFLVTDAGRVGIATVPKTWSIDALQLGTNLAISEDANSVYWCANAYANSGWKRINNQLAGYMRMGTNDGIWSFSNAVTGAVDSAISWNERMRINGDGNVGIGLPSSSPSPSAKLQVYSTAATNIFMTGYGTATQNNWLAQNCMFVKTDNGLLISKENAANNTNRLFNFYNDANGYAQLYMYRGDSTAQVQIKTSGYSYFNGGNVGIGVTSPGAKLEIAQTGGTQLRIVSGDASGSQDVIVDLVSAFDYRGRGILYRNSDDSNKWFSGVPYNGGGYSIGYHTSQPEYKANSKLFVASVGNVGIGTTSPTEKLQIVQGGQAMIGDYFMLGSGNANYMGTLGFNRNTTNGVIYNSSYGAFQIHNNNGTLCLQGYAAGGGNEFEHLFFNNGDVFFDGSVGIATTSTKGTLDVFRANGGSGTCAIAITNSEAGALSRNWGISTDIRAAGDFGILESLTRLGTPTPANANLRLYMTSGGDLALGMQDYNANPSSTNYGLRLETGATGKSYWQSAVNAATSHYHYEFINTTGSVGTIRTLNSATSYVTNSDYRLKEDLQDFNGLDKVSKIPVYNFKWKIDDTRSYGVMAHELDVVLPDAVSGEKDDVNEDKSINPQGVDYSKIVPLLVKSIQELEARLKILENK